MIEDASTLTKPYDNEVTEDKLNYLIDEKLSNFVTIQEKKMEEARNQMASTIVNDVKNTLRQFEERMLKLGEIITNNTTGMFQNGNLIQAPLAS